MMSSGNDDIIALYGENVDAGKNSTFHFYDGMISAGERHRISDSKIQLNGIDDDLTVENRIAALSASQGAFI